MSASQPPGQSTAEKFYRYFQNELSALQEQIGRLEQHSVTGGERTDAIEHCSAGIARLTADVRDVIDSLPAHDRQSYNDSLKSLSTKFQTVKSQLSGKQKFSFKNSTFKVHKNHSAISLHDAAELAQQKHDDAAASDDVSLATTPVGSQTPDSCTAPGLEDKGSIVDIHNKVVSPLAQPPLSSVARLSHTIVDLSSCGTQTLSLRDVSDSIIVCPRVAGPIHLTNIHRSIIAVDCRQFRMHDSISCDVYLHCSSRPIIENCKGIRFAPAEGVIPQADGDNLWSSVDDFKWLRAEHSPNWSILADEERLSAAAWAQIGALKDGDPSDVLLSKLKRPS